MSTINEDYAIGWSGHASNFSISFEDLLQQKELVDVTLVADGSLFSAHRLVLSAVSPYFRQMFIQMPANQQAYVFMKDVSKQITEDLITFIYCGEVKVLKANIDEFLKTAKALKIKGLTFDSRASTSICPAPACNCLQYNSSQTVQVPTSDNRNLADSSNNNAFKLQDNFKSDFGTANSMNRNYCEMDTNSNNCSYGNDMSHDYASMNQNFETENDQWDGDSGKNLYVTPVTATAPKAKRLKRMFDPTEFNIVADIRENRKGGENLFYNGFKYTKYGRYVQVQSWRCTRSNGLNCPGTVSTMVINGVIMMKVLKADHTHQPEELTHSGN